MSNTSFRAVTEGGSVQASDDLRETVSRLTALAVDGLVPMFDPGKQLFCFTLKRAENGMLREGISHRYTMMTLMGLHRFEESGGVSPIPIKPVIDVLFSNLEWVDNVGDLGVLLWLCALVAPERVAEVERRLDVKDALLHSREARQGRTMELAWFLTGLSHAALVCPERVSRTRDLATETYRMLVKNQGEQGVFGHLGRKSSPAGLIRSRIGSFADQVYPIYGMTRFSQAYGDKNAMERALDCALRICEAQGSAGQWWWHYDSANGRVAGRFPVFSVHQHAMGPMALLALGEAIQSDFTPWIQKGLLWIRDNELAFDMEDDAAKVVWRSQYRPTSRRLWSTVMSLLSRREEPESRYGLKVMYECRPYELGWLLYAFANWKQSQFISGSRRTPDNDA
jgi:hypothetical protein